MCTLFLLPDELFISKINLSERQSVDNLQFTEEVVKLKSGVCVLSGL
jgi:hypothetical protein